MEAETVSWLRKLDNGMGGYSDEEIWRAWLNGGAEEVVAQATGRATNIIEQASVLKRVASCIHRAVKFDRFDRAQAAARADAQARIAAFNYNSNQIALYSTTNHTNVAAIMSAQLGFVGVEKTPIESLPALDDPPAHAFTILRGRGKDMVAFCDRCGEMDDDTFTPYECSPVDPDEVRAKIEKEIARLTKQAPGQAHAWARIQRIKKAESGRPWDPLKSWGRRLPVERFPRRYQDIVGGWNKRAVQ